MPNADPTIIQAPERLETLRQIGLGPSAVESFDRLTRLASRLIQAPVALVSFVESDCQFFPGAEGLSEELNRLRQTPISGSFCQHVVDTGQPLVIEDARTHPLVHDNESIEKLNVIAYAGLPMRLSNGATLGSFCVIDQKPRRWTEEELAALADLKKYALTELELRALARSEMDLREQLKSTIGLLEEENRRIDRLEKLKTDMIRIAAHDLRTPLNTMNGCAEVLRDMQDRNSLQGAEYVGHIKTGVRQMNDLIHNILSLERIEAMETQQERSRLNLADLMVEALGKHTLAIEQQKLQVDIQGLDDEVMVHGDPVQLVQAMENLISNAIKYTPPSGSIRILLCAEGDRAKFEVEDNGFGIPTERQERLFEPFYRVRTCENAKIQGVGLGLSLVKQIVERHDGRILFRSVYGEGSLFGFELPLAEV